ncbi:hypothetical protein GSF08_09685 [Clostridiaceae bacterium DONG20-135]|uniref:Phage-related protein n=1 Tax=Copranaerobaculum intestinale TaxID=2692629 RepID=A0A6N8U7P3_9FIRM|nr:hypothetical protein [Copranaerobaculum intestinale]MXQ74206.1 hypothetical protein [Copranaerobaculum intestinale]
MAETIRVQLQPDIDTLSAQLRNSILQAFNSLNSSLSQTGVVMITTLDSFKNRAISALKAMAKIISSIQMPQFSPSGTSSSTTAGGSMEGGNGPPKLDSLITSFKSLRSAFNDFKNGFKAFDELKTKLLELPGNIDFLTSKINSIPISFETLKSTFGGISGKFSDLKGSLSSLKEGFSGIGLSVSSFTSSLVGSLKGLFEVVKANPLGALLTVLQLLIPVFIDLYNNNEGFRNLIDSIIGTIADTVVPIIETVSSFLQDFWDNCLAVLIDVLMNLWETVLLPLGIWLGEVLMGALNIVSGILMDLFNNILVPFANFLSEVFTTVIKTVMDVWSNWQPAIQMIWELLQAIWNNVLQPIASWLMDVLCSAFHMVENVVSTVIDVIINVFTTFFDVVSGVWDALMEIISGVINFLSDVFMAAWNTVFSAVGTVIGGMGKTVSDVFESLKKIFNGIIDFITGVFSSDWGKAWDGIRSIFSGIFDGAAAILKGPINIVIGMINSAIKALNKISIDIPDWLGGGHIGFDIPRIKPLATGGIIDQPTLAIVGEAGREAVMPLEHNTGWITQLASDLNVRMGSHNNDRMEKLLSQLILEVRGLDLNIDGKKAGKLISSARKELSMIR